MTWLKYAIYRAVMRLAHRFNWHYAPPCYPEGDTHLWCQWCGFRQTVKRASDRDTISVITRGELERGRIFNG